MDINYKITQSLNEIPMSCDINEFENEYNMYETIGEGGFGKVKKAIRVSDNQCIAIKYINQSKISNWHHDTLRNINVPMEIALLCHCRSIDGVIKIQKYFFIKERKGWFVVMERFENYIDLFDHITNRGQIDEFTAADFLIQLLNILKQCHQMGICHRDIKDENIIINLDTMKIHLIDFGAGGILHNNFYTEFDGTRVYSPPEWIQHKKYQAVSLEIWSIGILLYDMVCGNLPFDNDESITKSQLLFRRPITRCCKDLISLCLEKDPNKRIQLDQICMHKWILKHTRKFSSIQIEDIYNQNGHNNSFYNYLFHQNSVNSSYSISPISQSSCNSPVFDNSSSSLRRVSVETSPFVTPQSSGIDELSVSPSSSTSSPSSSYNYPSCNMSYYRKSFNHSLLNSDNNNPCQIIPQNSHYINFTNLCAKVNN